MKLSKPAKERNEIDRADYILRISQYTSRQLVFGDESAYDKRTLSRRYGWSLTGTRAEKPSFFIRGQRFTIEGALCTDGLLAYGIQEGPMSAEYFVEHILVQYQCFLLIINKLNPIFIIYSSKYEPISWTI